MTNKDAPTNETYTALNKAFDFYNKKLFSGELPSCVIVMARRKGTAGYYIPNTWGKGMEGDASIDEIALNPDILRLRPVEETLSTLVHEMCHMQQEKFGKPSNNGYHNKEWADMMDAVGLVPSDTGKDGGKRTGPRMTHYIEDGGVFEVATSALVKSGFEIPWTAIIRPRNKAKTASKTKYTCGECGANAWAKPEANIWCGECDEQMECEE